MFDAGLHITIPPQEQVLQVACGASSPPVRFRMLHDEHGASDYIALGGAPAGEAAVPVVAGPMEGRLNLEVELAARFPDHEAALRNYFELAERYEEERASTIHILHVQGYPSSFTLAGNQFGVFPWAPWATGCLH